MKSGTGSMAEAAIARRISAFIAAYNAGDADALLSVYSEDLLKLRQGAPDEPKAETARRLRDVFAKFRGHLDVDNVETFVSGDLAVSRGTLDVRLTPKDGGERKTVRRRYLEIWRNEGGTWRVFRTMDNTPE